ncbi:hypothetical protein UCRPC4_g05371 [Phaeomoniella chlamydospora]|uniref:Uncharacterized protein n=1 Tax=Phaeomoniella chlamydospora TaxID=158046 RepID=A0A0G2G1C1_PHACM|nr:hypothetical protein UCRPC4_g05371 [Phaeomoniella chlamydospora]
MDNDNYEHGIDENEIMNNDIAAAMGFSGFGTQDKGRKSRAAPSSPRLEPAPKRTKFDQEEISNDNMNPNAPAFVSQAASTASTASSTTDSNAHNSQNTSTTTITSTVNHPTNINAHTSANLIPASILSTSNTLPPRPPPQNHPQQQHNRNRNNNNRNNQRNNRRGNHRDNQYNEPWVAPSGRVFSPQELRDYAQGKIKNEKGDTVYFKPSFIDPDPWAALRQKKAEEENTTD